MAWLFNLDNFIFLQVGQYYYSKVCGLCGNMDSNPSNDFEGPLKVNHPYGSTMSAVYLVPDHHCDATDIQKKLGVPDIQKQASEYYTKYL